jgi:hypothetical protein
MEEIILYDNFLNDYEVNTALSIIKKNNWKFGHTSKNLYNYETPFWIMDLMENDFFSIYLKDIIEKTFSKKFKVERLYANGQTYGQDGIYHTDSENSNSYTFVLYLTKIPKEYIEMAGGNIFFKLPDYKYSLSYEPIFNRGIFFPSNYIHKSTSFTRFIVDLRISVAWKLIEIE